MKKIYVTNHYNFVDQIVTNKRQEMCNLINEKLNGEYFLDALDIGSTNDTENKSSNYLIKNIKKVKFYKSISNQKITSSFFSQKLKKSIIDNFTKQEIKLMKSDLVVSNATIEHVGNFQNQKKMIKNILLLTRKKFILTTPNRYHPIDFHTKLPFIHWFPKEIHRNILKILKLDFFSKEENLNLLCKSELIKLVEDTGIRNYKIFDISLYGFKSNYILIGVM
tara:strand:- start:980 stop:1645 length:666 start_codon:yes stop_codon:yes gene_type:complete